MALDYGSMMQALQSWRARQAQAKIQRNQQKAATTKGLMTLGMMAAGALTGGAAFGAVPAFLGGGEAGLGTVLAGASMGSSVGNLTGGVATGQPVGMNEITQGLGIATRIRNQDVRSRAYDGDIGGSGISMAEAAAQAKTAANGEDWTFTRKLKGGDTYRISSSATSWDDQKETDTPWWMKGASGALDRLDSLPAEDQDIYRWAVANPQDKRSKEIRRRLGM